MRAVRTDGGADANGAIEGLRLPIPTVRYRCHYVQAKVRAHRHADGTLVCSTARALRVFPRVAQ